MRWLMSVAAMLVLAVSRPAMAQDRPLPKTPVGSKLLFAQPDQKVIAGEAWLTDTKLGHKSYHLHGTAAVEFDLSPLQLPAGYYRLGLIARTGTQWNNATGQIARYRLELSSGDDKPMNLGGVQQAMGESAEPVRDSGEPGSWANWYGSVQSTTPCYLSGKDRLVIFNEFEHGGVVAVWVLPVSKAEAVSVTIATAAPVNAFIAGQTPTININLSVPAKLEAFDAQLRIEQFDFLTEQTSVTHTPLSLKPGGKIHHAATFPAVPGLYRVSAMIVTDVAAKPSENVTPASCLYAYSPAKLARDLPDDWPLAGHVTSNIPPMPGFRWYRYFASWADIHTGPGKFDWAEFDAVYKQVQDAGGKLLIAYDGTPTWAVARGKAGMPWSANATAYPPDDWAVLQSYLETMLRRYDDRAETLAALELCNEANTIERWQGSPAQMVEMAKTFRRATKVIGRRVPIMGLAVSAGHHEKWVNDQVAAGLLSQVDMVSAHFYEELGSFERQTPINNLPRHVDLLTLPLEKAKLRLPMINSESGIEFVHRQNGRMPSQTALNRIAEADPQWNRKEPWLIGTQWRPVSERRAAAMYVTSAVALMSRGVKQTFCFSHLDFLLDGAPSLPWVAVGQLGH